MIHKNVYRLHDLRQIYDRSWCHCVTCKDAFATRNVTPGHTHQFARNTANIHHRRRLLDGCLAQATVSSGYQDETAVVQYVHCYIYRIVYYSLSLDCRITTIILYQLNACKQWWLTYLVLALNGCKWSVNGLLLKMIFVSCCTAWLKLTQWSSPVQLQCILPACMLLLLHATTVTICTVSRIVPSNYIHYSWWASLPYVRNYSLARRAGSSGWTTSRRSDVQLEWLSQEVAMSVLYWMGRISVSETARGDTQKHLGNGECIAGTILTRNQQRALPGGTADSHQEEKQRLGRVWGWSGAARGQSLHGPPDEASGWSCAPNAENGVLHSADQTEQDRSHPL